MPVSLSPDSADVYFANQLYRAEADHVLIDLAMDPATQDAQLRQAAFSHVDRLATLRGGVLDSADLAGGFEFGSADWRRPARTK